VAKPLSDAQVVRHAAEYRRLRMAAKELEKQAEPHKEAVIAELQRRGAKRLEVAGLSVVLKAKTTTTYVYERAKERLSSSQLRRITRPVIDRKLVAVELDAGRLAPTELAAFAETTTSAPYLDVSEKAS